jgi:signal peptidase I
MPYTVEGASMATNFHDKDFIIVDKITPKYSTLQRGDVVVFVPPGKDIPFIKRIVGMPGETVKLIG